MESKAKRKFKIDATQALKKTDSRSGRTAARGGGKRKPLADCTNTVAFLASSQSSSTSVIEPPKSSSTSFPPTSQLKDPNSNARFDFPKAGKSPGDGSRRNGKGTANPSSDRPSLPQWMSVSGAISSDYSGSVYIRRKSKGKAISESEPLNFPEPEVTTVPNKRGKINEGGNIGHSKLSAVTVPQTKKQRVHTLSQEFIKTQKDYFDEIDKFELPVEEVASDDELE